MRYLLPDKTYNILKWVGLVALPAIATFVGTVGTAVEWAAIYAAAEQAVDAARLKAGGDHDGD